MSASDSLYTLVHARFRHAFGPPKNAVGGGEQWTLQPNRKYANTIHVLLNGTRDGPGVWVFDPHDRVNGVKNTPIREAREIGELISLIQSRLDAAGNE
jgi:hypothetical protein